MANDLNSVAQAASEVALGLSRPVMTTGGAAGALGWMFSNEALGAAGFLVALLGLVLGRLDKHFDKKRKAAADARAAEIHALVVARLKVGLPPDLDPHMPKEVELDE